MSKYILAIDQGTTGSRAFVFDHNGRIAASAYREFKQYFPYPGWVEHDADEIWQSCVSVIKEALDKSRIPSRNILAIGITNQRETVLGWDRQTSQPVGRAIVWQCRRTTDICRDKRFRGFQDAIRHKTGLLLDPYFSGTKIKWLLENLPGLKSKALKGKILFGTIDSWLIWKLSHGKIHATDTTNASRTLLFNIRKFQWDQELLRLFGIPPQVLPEVKNSGSLFARTSENATGLIEGIPITAVMGDQQAALYGQGCYDVGTLKNTYGTGCFLVLNTGKKLITSKKGLLSTVASDFSGRPIYAMEGPIFITGALMQWLRDQLGIIKSSAESEIISQDLANTQGVYVVPAFTGLGCPYWDSQARGIITGLTRGTNAHHIVRASLEAIAYQTRDVFDIMVKELGRSIKELRVDGGACRNNFLMQFQADILSCPIVRPKTIETTAQGVAHLAGVTMGLWRSKEDLNRLRQIDKVFRPIMAPALRTNLYAGWRKAVNKALLSG